MVAIEDILLRLNTHEMIDRMRLMIKHNYTKFENVQKKSEELVHKTLNEEKFSLIIIKEIKLTSAMR